MRVKTCECGWKVFNSSSRVVSVACPQCGKQIVCKAGRRLPFPLGDHLDRLLSYVGGRQFKQWYHKLTGWDCGCEKRKHWLNRAGGWIHAKAMQMWGNR